MYFENHRRCSSCGYCKEIGETKDGKFEVVAIECTNKYHTGVLEDVFCCEDYEDRLVARMARTYEQTQEVKREKEYKRVKDITEKVKETDMVNHPKHYANSCSIECIDAMQATFGIKDLAKYCAVNAYKYLWRYKSKNGLEDLKKAEWYLNKFDELVEEAENKPYSEQISSRYVNICITLRKWLKTANTALGGHTVNEE
mgnify:CR=1 FL=1